MAEIDLTALEGKNPLGFLAALGCVAAVARAEQPASRPRLTWTADVVPHAVLDSCATDSDELIDLLLADLSSWQNSLILEWALEGELIDEVKLPPEELHVWAQDVVAGASTDRRDADLFCGLVAETAVDNNGNTKPTDLHFMAGRQRFLRMARELRDNITAADLEEALFGPWTNMSPLPTFDWDCAAERVWALRAGDPSKEKKLGVPGANWLAFTALSFIPVLAHRQRVVTTGSSGTWKQGKWMWPLWSVPLTVDTIRSLLVLDGLDRLEPDQLRRRGLLTVLRAPIRRTDQGGYGSIGIPEVIVDAV